MSILTASLLLKGGSMLLDLFGSSKGGKNQQVTSAISGVIKAVQGKPQAEQVNTVARAVEALSPEQKEILSRIQVDLAQIDAEREQNTFQHDIAMHTQQQETIRAGDKAQGKYVKETRPKMARFSGYVGSVYVVLMEAANLFGKGEGAQLELAAALFTPLLAYMGLRTWDAFSPHKGPKL